MQIIYLMRNISATKTEVSITKRLTPKLNARLAKGFVNEFISTEYKSNFKKFFLITAA